MKVIIIINYIWVFINICIIIPFLIYHAFITDDIYYKIVLGFIIFALIITEGYNMYLLLNYGINEEEIKNSSSIISNDLVVT